MNALTGKKIAFLLWSIEISGGTNVIIHHAKGIQKEGACVDLVVFQKFKMESLKWNSQLESLNLIGPSEALCKKYDFVIATYWKTALELQKYSSKRYVYFVQSIESRFFNQNLSPLVELVNSTYDLPVDFITEATWIKQHLKKHHKQNAFLIRNGIDKSIFNNRNRKDGEHSKAARIVIEGNLSAPFKNTLLAVKVARKAGFRNITLVTSTEIKYLPMVTKIYSGVSQQEIANIYKEHDLLVKLSTVEGMFGPPLEMFHCGGTAVSLVVTGAEEYMKNNINSILVPEEDWLKMVWVLRQLLNSPEEILRLKSGAIETANNWNDWEVSSKKFAYTLLKISDTNNEVQNEIGVKNQLSLDKYHKEEVIRLNKNPTIRIGYALLRLLSLQPKSIKQILIVFKLCVSYPFLSLKKP